MIVLDTNVLSEPLRTEADSTVVTWIQTQVEVTTTAVSVAELLTGVRRLPVGQRRDALLTAVEKVLVAFPTSVLPYDDAAARRYAEFYEARRAEGRPLSVEDGMIAAICSVRSLPLATCNTKDFVGLGLRLVNPWTAG